MNLPDTQNAVTDPESIAEQARSLRIAIISDAESERNGVGAYYYDLVDHLHDRVDSIELICPGHADIDHGITFPLPGDATQRVWLPPVRQINEKIKKLEPHIIIVPTPGPFGLYGSHLAKKYKAQLVVGFHTHFEKIMDLYWSRWFGYLTVGYFELLNRHLFKKASVILANSDEMVEIASQRSRKPVELMGTPIPRAFVEKPTEPVRDSLKSVLYAGRLAAEKNIETVIEAAECHPELRFSIAGDGPIRDVIEKAAQRLSNLEYLGWLTRSEMLGELDTTDMLVLPSHVESFGTIAMEAMARSRIVLVSSHCGIREWPDLKPGLFEIDENESVSTAISRIKELPPETLKEKSEMARAGAVKLSQWNVDNWLRLLTRQYDGKAA